MEQFKFVTLTHPDAVKNKANQNVIRAHVKRASLLRSQKQREQNSENGEFIISNGRGNRKRKPTEKTKSITQLLRSPSADLADPFSSLPGSPERLRRLMRHGAARQAGEPIFCVDSVGTFIFQDLETVFHGALADPALFHALSLSLELAANGGKPSAECLVHKGEVLTEVSKRMGESMQRCHGSTLSSILLLIGYEYRLQDANQETVEVHLRALQELVNLYNQTGIYFCDTLRRALFWQDLISSFVLGTLRFLSHELLPELYYVRDPYRSHLYIIPSGFLSLEATIPRDMLTLLEDLNALCTLIDAKCMCGHIPINKIQIDNIQGFIESRVVDLLNDYRLLGMYDPLYESTLYAVYLCTYQLSTSVWEGNFIPTFCTSQILRTLNESSRGEAPWFLHSELLTWLLYLGGALATVKKTRLHFAALILGTYAGIIANAHENWEELEILMGGFGWSKAAFGARVRQFWEEVHPS